MSISDLFLFAALAVVILWTLRLARSKNRNPWLWGGVAVLLSFIPWLHPLLAMGPMVLLLFLKSPQAVEKAGPNTVTCPRCHTNHLAGYTFCVNCGWELAKPYEEGSADREKEPSGPVRASSGTGRADGAQATGNSQAASGAPSSSNQPESAPAADSAPASEQPQEPEAPPTRPSPKVVKTTPGTLTERGISLFNQGRFQEAVDQFTKAIALDPTYKPAWAQRAEAYGRLGRSKEADDDLRRLQAI